MFVPECASSISDLVSWCGKDEVVIYGTGKVGKLLIPLLRESTDLKILGITNSRIKRGGTETFLDTGLPLRSLQEWYEKFPEATILIAVVRQDYQYEIAGICKEAGFKKILGVFSTIEPELLSARAARFFTPENKAFLGLLMPQIDAYLVDRICLANEVQSVHKASFGEFRGCHKNQSVALLGSGPSLNYYTQLNGVPHIGVNTVFLKPGIKLDYYFTRDYAGRSPWFQDLKDYDFVKFFGTAEWTNESREVYQIPETIIEENHARKFISQSQKEYIHCDIEHYPLMAIGSIIFAAAQFALFTNPKRIFLVGCDCSDNGHYDGSDGTAASISDLFVDSWRWLKKYADRFYPGIEIVSINPIGLKGMFRDVYTEAYLDAHPEIDRSACTTLDSLNLEAE